MWLPLYMTISALHMNKILSVQSIFFAHCICLDASLHISTFFGAPLKGVMAKNYLLNNSSLSSFPLILSYYLYTFCKHFMCTKCVEKFVLHDQTL